MHVAAEVSNVELTVFRRGGLGDVVVSWSTGTSTAAGFAPGSLLPASGSLQFPPQQNTTTLTLTVSPRGSTCADPILFIADDSG